VPVTENEYLNGLRHGDEVVFESIFRNYYAQLCNYANTFTNDIDEAEEIVQATFLNLWEKHESVDIQISVRAYLYRAVANNCINRVKHLKVRKKHNDEAVYLGNESSENNLEQVLGSELEQLIKQTIDSLPSQCQTVFKLSRYEGLSYSEIAGQLGLSVKTVDNHISKALRILKDKLKEYLPALLSFFVLLFKD
jgi:RNA polymerase sigma-70 factor (family 1)